MLVFLDIDGVMVPAKGWKMPELLNDGFPAFSIQSVQVLQELVSEGATIMLTTSHKSKFSLEKWEEIFNERGVKVNHIECLPENTGYLSRKDEILQWFKSNDVDDNFIIIDDDKSLNDLPIFFKRRFLQTSGMIGLIMEHSSEIKRILNVEPEMA